MRLRPELCVLPLLFANGCSSVSSADDWPVYPDNPFIIRMDIPAPTDDRGSVIVSDLNSDGLMDYLVTVPGHVTAHAHTGQRMWLLRSDVRVSMDSEKWGLPGQQAPAVQAADVDGDGDTEVLFLTQDSVLHVVCGATGSEKWRARPPVPDGAERWEHLVVGNFRGRGDRDILLQTTNAKGYRMGRYVTAYAIDDLKKGDYTPLWERGDFLACAHTAARLADLDGDGKDEVLGGTILNSKGELLYRIPLTGHIDAIAVDDVRPDVPGLEVVALEEGDMNKPENDRTFLCNGRRLIWANDHKDLEPQDAAVGDFDPGRQGLEVFCRHRGNGWQHPYVFDSHGRLISEYKMEDVVPEGWSKKGVQVVQTIDWTGGPKQLVAAMERGGNGQVAIFDPIDGQFLHQFKETADRLYVVDVCGDWREELILIHGSEIHVYRNDQPNPNPGHHRLWTLSHYRRGKMTWNYSSQ